MMSVVTMERLSFAKARAAASRGVAVQVECETKGLKPGYHFIGSRVVEMYADLSGLYLG
jgi:hypothetical protein